MEHVELWLFISLNLSQSDMQENVNLFLFSVFHFNDYTGRFFLNFSLHMLHTQQPARRFHCAHITQSEYKIFRCLSLLLLLKTMSKASSSLCSPAPGFAFMSAMENLGLVLIFVEPALWKLWSSCYFYPKKMPKYLFTTKKSSTFSPSLVCYKRKHSINGLVHTFATACIWCGRGNFQGQDSYWSPAKCLMTQQESDLFSAIIAFKMQKPLMLVFF